MEGENGGIRGIFSSEASLRFSSASVSSGDVTFRTNKLDFTDVPKKSFIQAVVLTVVHVPY